MDMEGQVVFFTPKGKALLGAPRADQVVTSRPMELGPLESGQDPGGNGELGPLESDPSPLEEEPAGNSQLKPYHQSGGSRWKRDSDIPWEVEAQAWDALEEASG